MRLAADNWVMPRRAQIGDAVVIFVMGLGFFASARVTSNPEPCTDWKNRYSAGIDATRLIDPPISIGTIQVEVLVLE